MANVASAEKRNRQTLKRTQRNRRRISRIRTFVRRVEEALSTGDKVAATDAFKAAMPELHRGVSKGVLHRNTASRKISRLHARVAALG